VCVCVCVVWGGGGVNLFQILLWQRKIFLLGVDGYGLYFAGAKVIFLMCSLSYVCGVG
jgi:hypothetical protein